VTWDDNMGDPASGLFRAVKRFLTAIPPVPPQALSVFHAAVGAAILAGDSRRFSGASFAGARQIAGLFGVPEPRAWIAWGGLLVTVGVVMVFVWPWFEVHHPRMADRRRPDGCWERRHLNRPRPRIDGGRR
jgi:hypothetical protein